MLAVHEITLRESIAYSPAESVAPGGVALPFSAPEMGLRL
jgi:hypothetical protein